MNRSVLFFPIKILKFSIPLFTICSLLQFSVSTELISSNSSEQKTVKYYTYDAKLFKMYNNCLCKPDYCHYSKWNLNSTEFKHFLHQGSKHLNELYFTDQLLQRKAISTKDEAQILILPVFLSLSILGLCGNHTENVEDLRNFVLKEINDGMRKNITRKFLIVAVAF